MKINTIKNTIKVGEAQLDNTTSSKIWNIVWNPSTPNHILTQNNGRVYFIVVNDTIYKINNLFSSIIFI